MFDANHQEKLAHICQNLLQLSHGSAQDKAFCKKASTTCLLKKLWGEGINNAWWEREKDIAPDACIFNDEQVDNLRAFGSFMNYKQNMLGPIEDESKPRFNIMEVTADRYEDFVCNFDGTLIKYDVDVATKYLRTRSGYESRHQRDDNMGTPRSPRAYGIDTLVKVERR